MKTTLIAFVLLFLSSCSKENDVFLYTTNPTKFSLCRIEVNGQIIDTLPYSTTELQCNEDSLALKSIHLTLENGFHRIYVFNNKNEEIMKGTLRIKDRGYSVSCRSDHSTFMKSLREKNRFVLKFE